MGSAAVLGALVRPGHAAGGQWSGRILVHGLSLAGGRVFAYRGDIAAYSPALTPQGR